ncbi:hypothetical protein F5146DRAFT_766929 [Armillaria mellea]|nr:hypothetical protein F5146DRAFT_766929 [Armillaria mellea]
MHTCPVIFIPCSAPYCCSLAITDKGIYCCSEHRKCPFAVDHSSNADSDRNPAVTAVVQLWKSLSSSQPTPPSHNPATAPTKTTQTPRKVTRSPSSASPKTPVLSKFLSPSTVMTDKQHNSSASPSTTVSASTTSTSAIVSASTNTARAEDSSTFTNPSDPIVTTVQKPTSISSTQTCTSAQHINNTTRSVDSSNVLQMRRDRGNRPLAPAPNLDWIVPQAQTDIHAQVKTAAERLRPTIVLAEETSQMYAERAMMNGYAMNVAIGIQLLVGSLTTAISALVTRREVTIVLPILGAILTVTAAFLIKARGSNEPEQSLMVARDLEQFIRECKAFLVDFGSDTDKKEVQRLRNRFEEILRGATDMEKK